MIKVAFLGAGNMATAMVSGLLEKSRYRPDELICLSAPDGSAEKLSSETGIRRAVRMADLLEEARTVVLAIKPQHLAGIDDSDARLTRGKLILSILAGTPLAKLRAKFPEAANIVRAMPNTPGQIGAGITCFAPLEPLEGPDERIVEGILGAMGAVLPLPEENLDAVTAVSGSGPAYVFEFIAALREGGVKAGLDPDTAARLALETTLGASRLLARTGETPEVLRDRVTSPGGTTMAGLEMLEASRFRDILAKTVLAAKARSRELSRET